MTLSSPHTHKYSIERQSRCNPSPRDEPHCSAHSPPIPWIQSGVVPAPAAPEEGAAAPSVLMPLLFPVPAVARLATEDTFLLQRIFGVYLSLFPPATAVSVCCSLSVRSVEDRHIRIFIEIHAVFRGKWWIGSVHSPRDAGQGGKSRKAVPELAFSCLGFCEMQRSTMNPCRLGFRHRQRATAPRRQNKK